MPQQRRKYILGLDAGLILTLVFFAIKPRPAFEKGHILDSVLPCSGLFVIRQSWRTCYVAAIGWKWMWRGVPIALQPELADAPPSKENNSFFILLILIAFSPILLSSKSKAITSFP